MRKRTYASRSRSRSVVSKKKAKTSYISPSVRTPSRMSVRTGQGSKTWVNMVYAETQVLTGGLSGLMTIQQFRINSLFDPNFSLGGHQPGGFDQYAALFQDYVVSDCHYKVTFLNIGSRPSFVGVYVSDTNDFTTSNKTEIIEQGLVDWDLIGQETAGSPNKRTFTGHIDVAKLMGQTRSQLLGSTDYETSVTENPDDPGFLTCFAGDYSSSNGSDVILYVELTFTARLAGTRLVPQS